MTVLIYEDILSFRSKRGLNHHLFILNQDGLLHRNSPVMQGRYHIRCFPNCENMQKYYDPSYGRENEFEATQHFQSIMSQTQPQLELSSIFSDSDHERTHDNSFGPNPKKRKVSKSTDIFMI
ncbi:unnamed protein product [Ambrosiozyma monospora]|uniref:Unnamed protein product n=1 Tax=Ambrosiozyma monospora TaxID=43982 RepID=A0ACB5TBL7_AMBMO|nr:unnamed protein product [Ambrosiozyma monospora]